MTEVVMLQEKINRLEHENQNLKTCVKNLLSCPNWENRVYWKDIHGAITEVKKVYENLGTNC